MAAIANKIVIGDLSHPLFTFENESIREIYSDTAVSLIGDELYIDQFSPVLDCEALTPYTFKPTDSEGIKTSGGEIFSTRHTYNLRELPYGTRITFFTDDVIVGEFFCKRVERTGKNTYKLNAMSAIGLMDKQYHMGNIYTGQLFPAVLAEILGNEYEYEIDSNTSIATQRVFGWLPYSTRRRNLHQLMVAYGVNLVKNELGKMKFTYLDESDPIPINDAQVFSGGSVRYDEPASRVEVTEHTFRYDSRVEEETIWDNTQDDVADHTLVTFDKPIYPESVHGTDGDITIHSIGVNYAYISGLGVLVGKPYLHTTKVVSADNESAVDEKIVKIEEATLVTLMNSENVLERLSQYYFNATMVKQDIVNEGEKAGGRYVTHNVFGEPVIGFISKMSTRVTSFKRSSCEIIQGYVPSGAGVNYPNRHIVPLNTNASSQWTIPSAVFQKDKPLIRVVLIGFGEDGTRGEDGESGTVADSMEIGHGGAGGSGGKGGKGGKIFSVTLDVTGFTKLNFSNSGKNSIMTTTPSSSSYSSANGASLYAGFYDPYDGTVYALPGMDGVSGGNGGDSEVKSYHSMTFPNKAKPGEGVTYNSISYTGGSIGERDRFVGMAYSYGQDFPDKYVNGYGRNDYLYFTVFINGCGGGGAAVGADGGDGLGIGVGLYYNSTTGLYAGTGGAGGNAASPPATIALYGQGGNGGHGGGGGGASGMREYYNMMRMDPNALPPDETDSVPTLGLGGAGSAGTAGYYGCAIIYY